MTNRRHLAIIFPVLLALGILAVSLLLLSSGVLTWLLPGSLAQGAITHYVALGGDCGEASPCYAHPQEAVDAASDGDTIKVAQGVYTGAGFQVVYINEAITLTGGYTTTDWANSYPVTRPTVIDAENIARRRGVYIDGTGVSTITLRGVIIQRGCAHYADGSNVYIVTGTVVLCDSRVLSTAMYCSNNGGGLYVEDGNVVLSGNIVQNNLAQRGGGVYVKRGTVTLISNTIASNLEIGGGFGGGVYAPEYDGSIVLIGNTIVGNSAGRGAGLSIRNSPNTVTLIGNTIISNSGYRGGGIEIAISTSSAMILKDNSFLSNTAQYGSGIYVHSGNVSAQNDIIADNPCTWEGIYVSGGTLIARHWTLASNGSYGLTTNTSEYGSGSAILTNTIIASHTLGGLVGPNIGADHTLFFNSGVPCSGGTSCANNLSGDPKFINPAAGDYHIGLGSAAVDQGVNTGVTTDIDGEPRPMRSGYDIGADEQPPPPVASFTHSAPNWVGQTTLFTNTTVVTGTVSYLWAFGDEVFSTAVSPTHAYTAPGTYTVVLTATNYGGSSLVTDTVGIYAASFTSSSPDWLGQTTTFTNTAVTSGTTNYLWSFDDGVTSTLESPTHTYASPGSYTVVLTATNFAGTGVATDTIIVYGLPDAGFTTSSPDWLGQSTVFTNSTTTTPPGAPGVTYLWSFGDGETSALENPTHAYTASGTYTVVLTATNAAGSDLATDSVIVYSAPSVTFTTSSPEWLGQPTAFTATVTTTPAGDPMVGLAWNFGDGTVQAGPETISHTYTSPGIYTIALTATNPAGSNMVSDTVTVYARPEAGFTTSSPDWLGQTTVFTNTTMVKPLIDPTVTFLWALGDRVTSTVQHPTHIYSASDMYTVELTATNAAGSGVATDTVIVYSPPIAGFSAHPSQGIRLLTVSFTDTTTTIPPGDLTLAHLWRFGDGETSSLPNPTHIYTEAKVYTVTLSVTNAAGSDTFTRTNYITVNPIPVQADFTACPTSGVAPLTVVFTNTSTGDYTESVWGFGDGMTGTLDSPTHTYTVGGAYTVTLTVSGQGGSDVEGKVDYIRVWEEYNVYLPLILRNPTVAFSGDRTMELSRKRTIVSGPR